MVSVSAPESVTSFPKVIPFVLSKLKFVKVWTPAVNGNVPMFAEPPTVRPPSEPIEMLFDPVIFPVIVNELLPMFRFPLVRLIVPASVVGAIIETPLLLAIVMSTPELVGCPLPMN